MRSAGVFDITVKPMGGPKVLLQFRDSEKKNSFLVKALTNWFEETAKYSEEKCRGTAGTTLGALAEKGNLHGEVGGKRKSSNKGKDLWAVGSPIDHSA
ncbi:hypothetical protein U1Q18_016623 [Sarracenia purpurea var. burkii]